MTSYFRDIIGRFSLLAGYDWDKDKKAKKEGICCLLSTESQVALARCTYHEGQGHETLSSHDYSRDVDQSSSATQLSDTLPTAALHHRRCHHTRAGAPATLGNSASKRSIRRFVITEKAPTRAWGQRPFSIVSYSRLSLMIIVSRVADPILCLLAVGSTPV